MLLLIGVLLHGIGFIARHFVAGYTPITSLFESLSFSAFAIVCVFLAFELRYHLRVLGAFVLTPPSVLGIIRVGDKVSVKATFTLTVSRSP